MENQRVKLISSDGLEFIVSKEAAYMSTVVAKYVEDHSYENEVNVPIDKVKGSVLAKVLEYCNKHTERQPPLASSAYSSGSWEEELAEWDTEYCDMEHGDLFDVILAANEMNVEDLLNRTTKAVTDQFKGKSPDEIREHFGIVNDYEPEAEGEAYKKVKWAFEFFVPDSMVGVSSENEEANGTEEAGNAEEASDQAEGASESEEAGDAEEADEASESEEASGEEPSEAEGPSYEGEGASEEPSEAEGPSYEGEEPSEAEGPSYEGEEPSKAEGPSYEGEGASEAEGASYQAEGASEAEGSASYQTEGASEAEGSASYQTEGASEAEEASESDTDEKDDDEP